VGRDWSRFAYEQAVEVLFNDTTVISTLKVTLESPDCFRNSDKVCLSLFVMQKHNSGKELVASQPESWGRLRQLLAVLAYLDFRQGFPRLLTHLEE